MLGLKLIRISERASYATSRCQANYWTDTWHIMDISTPGKGHAMQFPLVMLSAQPFIRVHIKKKKNQSSASLAFVRGIHRGPVNSPQKWPVTWKMLPLDDVIMISDRCLRSLMDFWLMCELSELNQYNSSHMHVFALIRMEYMPASNVFMVLIRIDGTHFKQEHGPRVSLLKNSHSLCENFWETSSAVRRKISKTDKIAER